MFDRQQEILKEAGSSLDVDQYATWDSEDKFLGLLADRVESAEKQVRAYAKMVADKAIRTAADLDPNGLGALQSTGTIFDAHCAVLADRKAVLRLAVSYLKV